MGNVTNTPPLRKCPICKAPLTYVRAGLRVSYSDKSASITVESSCSRCRYDTVYYTSKFYEAFSVLEEFYEQLKEWHAWLGSDDEEE